MLNPIVTLLRVAITGFKINITLLLISIELGPKLWLKNVQNYHIEWSFEVQLRTPIRSRVILILGAAITTLESVKIGLSLIN